MARPARGERGPSPSPLRSEPRPPPPFLLSSVPFLALLSLVLALRTRHCRTTSGAKPRAPAPRRRVSCCSDVSQDTFVLDFTCPLCAVQAFSIGLTSFSELSRRFSSLAAGGAAARTPTDPGRPLTSRRRRPAHKSDEIAHPRGFYSTLDRPATTRAEWRSGSDEDRDHAADVLADVGCVREDDVFRVVGPRAACSDHPGAVVLLQHACDC